MKVKRRLALFLAVSTALALTATACSSSSGSSATGGGASAGAAPYKIGFITSLSGPYASTLDVSLKAAQARVDLQNAQGGVNGHKIQLIAADDGGSPTTALTAAQELVESKGVLAVAPVSYVTSAMANYLHSAGVAVVGANIDGPEWGTQPNTNMFGTMGYMSPDYPANTTIALLFKKMGATNVACVGNNNPSGASACEGLKTAAKAVGVNLVYTNVSLSLTSTDFTSLALALKNSHATGMMLNLASSQALPLMVSLYQAGVKIPAEILAEGYGTQLLTSSSYVQAGQGVLFESQFTPVEIKNAGTEQMQAALSKYENITGIPDFNAYEGWIALDLLIQGLKNAGQTATKSSIISGMQQVTSYNADGVETSTLSFAPSGFGKGAATQGANGCTYFVKLTNTTYSSVTPQPICGQIVAAAGE
ncbi:MAG TPA: ABC transporter substrate-binding protein [Streptosporangiaceae bacterium]|jgi:branched-chain amino acid transport system substrate-binding protein|nr:ABC transporter substrate-binding protein [Streptosporangiaceae bacterium]